MNVTRMMLGKRVQPMIMRPLRKDDNGQQEVMHTHVHAHGNGKPHTHPHTHEPGQLDDHNHIHPKQ